MNGDRARPRSPLRGRYLIRNPVWNAAARLADSVATLAPKRRGSGSGEIRRVLIAIGGHLGDAVIATSVLPVLRRALPRGEIGVLGPSWARPVFGDHPDVGRFHAVDHWKLDRSGRPFVVRWASHRRMAAAAVHELRSARYDIGVDLYPYFPNSAPLLWRAGIPDRVGFTSGGLGPLFTRPLPWRDDGRHAADRHLELLVAAGLATGPLVPEYSLAPVPDRARAAVHALLTSCDVAPDDYLVAHMGSGDARKEWQAAGWVEVLRACAAEGRRLVLTGAGARESAAAAAVAGAVPGAVSLVDRLDWEELRAVVAGARLVLSVDTVTAHLAAAAGRPVIVLMAAMSDPAHWRPLGPAVQVLVHDVPCSPCFDSCEPMSCIRGITPARVMAAVHSRLREAAGAH